MATQNQFEPDPRGLPDNFDDARFRTAVQDRLTKYIGQPSDEFIAIVVGRLLLDGNTSPDRSDFRHAVKRAYDTGVAETAGTTNREHYERIATDILALRRTKVIRYQEFAAVADHVIAAADEGWNINDNVSRRSQVQVGLIKYADGTVDTGFASLDLPPIVSEDAANQEIEPINVQAVALLAASYEIEQTGAFDVVDQMVDLFMQGLVPVRDDSGGRSLNRYYWQAEDRLDGSARAAQYARVLGHGDTDRTDAQPNTQFDQLLLRFVSALVRYDSMLQVSNVVTGDVADRVASSEPVRKAAQDLAANASLYGWGFTIFAARKLSQQIDQVFDVLGQETLQRAYGVTGPWQLVERVSALELGSTPAIVQHRTRAQAIKDILDLLAGHATELSRSGAGRRFLPDIADLRSVNGNAAVMAAAVPRRTASSVSVEEYEQLVTAANNLLAVGGVTEDEITKYSTPVASPARGSIPVVGGDVGGFSSANLDQLRQLAQQGQFDQLQKLLGVGMG